MSEGSEQASKPRFRRGVYGISVASELSGFGIPALRLYEQYGLITPTRTGGGTRRYSDYDLGRLKRIAELIDAGVNLVGIGRVLDLEYRTDELERDNRRLEAENAQLRAERTTAMDTPLRTAPAADRLEQCIPVDADERARQSPAGPRAPTSRSRGSDVQSGHRPR